MESLATTDILQVIEAWPRRVAMWQLDHYFDSPIMLMTARALGVDTHNELIRLGFLTTVLALLAVVFWVLALQTPSRWTNARLILLSPIVAVLATGLGFYDPFTVLAWALLLFAWRSRRKAALVIGAVPLGIQHFEQAVFGIAVLTLTWLAVRDALPDAIARLTPLWAFPGIIGGKVLLLLFMASQEQALFARSSWLAEYLVDWTRNLIVLGPLLLWALFAGLWPLVVGVWLRRSTTARVQLVGAFLLGLLAMFLTGDRPRVFVLVALPSLVLLVIAYGKLSEPSLMERRVVEAVAWVAPPLIFFGLSVTSANVVDQTIPALLHLTGLG